MFIAFFFSSFIWKVFWNWDYVEIQKIKKKINKFDNKISSNGEFKKNVSEWKILFFLSLSSDFYRIGILKSLENVNNLFSTQFKIQIHDFIRTNYTIIFMIFFRIDD